MIFIVIGIIILIVSFVIALFSLLREQAKFEHEVGDDQQEKPREKVIDKPYVNGFSQDADTVLATQNLHNDLVKDQKQREELFFWDKPQNRQPNFSQEDSESQIARIQQELERKIEENKSKAKGSQSIDVNPKKLTGEISIADLKKDLGEG